MFILDTFIYEAINSMSDAFYWPMKIWTTIGKDDNYFLIIVILIWCVDFKRYSKLALIMPFSGLLSESLKILFHMPRPYHLVEGATIIENYGMPSGHALSATSFWSYIAYVLKKHFMWAISLIMIIGIGISRIYRESHFPSQVLVGFILGALLILGFIKLEKTYKDKFFGLSKTLQSLLIIAIPMILVFIASISYIVYHDGNGAHNLEASFQLAGLFIGFIMGLLQIRKQGEFKVRVAWWKQVIKLALCAISFTLYPLLLKYSCKIVDSIWLEGIISLTICFFVAMWFTYYAPMLFKKYKLVQV